MPQGFHLLSDLTYHKVSSRVTFTQSLGLSPKAAMISKSGSQGTRFVTIILLSILKKDTIIKMSNNDQKLEVHSVLCNDFSLYVRSSSDAPSATHCWGRLLGN